MTKSELWSPWELHLIQDAPVACMHVEVLRLRTFLSWKNYDVFPTKLARAGFFYKNEGDEVECFHCKGHIARWRKGENADEKHKVYFPHCLFIQGKDNRNIALVLPPDISQKSILVFLKEVYNKRKNETPIVFKSDEEYMDYEDLCEKRRRSPTPLSMPVSETQPHASVSAYSSGLQRREISLSPNTDLAVYSDSGNPQAEPLQCVTWNIQPRSESPSHRQGYRESRNAGSTELIALSISHSGENEVNVTDSLLPFVTETIVQEREPTTSFLETFVDDSLTASSDPRLMFYELNRLATLQIWPKKTIIDPSLMAATGFYYLGPGDKVRCVFCKGAMMNWTRGDDPRSEHLRYFGDRCPFLKGEHTDNVAIERRSESSSTSSSLQSITTNQRRPLSYTIQHIQDASSPELAKEDDRYVTFSGWPANKKQKPIDLARAGFFFTGTGDQVRCFFCDGGLCNWVPSDDPWTEHARWFPRCGFLIQTKGESFIRQIQERYETLGAENISLQPAAESTRRGLPSLSENPAYFDRRQVPAQMATQMVQRALTMGYPRDRVRDLVENRLRTIGEGYPSLTTLVEDLLESDVPDSQNQTSVVPQARRESTSLTVERQSSETTRNRSLPSIWPENTTQRIEELPTSSENSAQRIEGRPVASSAPRGSDNTLAKEIEEMRRQRLCKICLDAEANLLLLKCGHLVACVDCGRRLTRCPVCRGVIRGSVKAYLS